MPQQWVHYITGCNPEQGWFLVLALDPCWCWHVGGKHEGHHPLPASFTEDMTSRELTLGMEILNHPCLEGGCVIRPSFVSLPTCCLWVWWVAKPDALAAQLPHSCSPGRNPPNPSRILSLATETHPKWLCQSSAVPGLCGSVPCDGFSDA